MSEKCQFDAKSVQKVSEKCQFDANGETPRFRRLLLGKRPDLADLGSARFGHFPKSRRRKRGVSSSRTKVSISDTFRTLFGQFCQFRTLFGHFPDTFPRLGGGNEGFRDSVRDPGIPRSRDPVEIGLRPGEPRFRVPEDPETNNFPHFPGSGEPGSLPIPS